MRYLIVLAVAVIAAASGFLLFRAEGKPAGPLWDGKEAVGDYAKRAGIQDVEIHLTLDSNVTMKLVLIPAGKFTMGSSRKEQEAAEKDLAKWFTAKWVKADFSPEGPQHEVMISRPFYMGTTSVTQLQWKAIMGTEPWKGRGWSRTVGPDYPANYVSWFDANTFCMALSRISGRTVRLPTEAEREYACRAGTKTRFSFGEDPEYAKLGDYAWYNNNCVAVEFEKKFFMGAVGTKKPNGWGLYDMHGNVSEWCSDWYGENYYADVGRSVDPSGPTSGTYRVARGGSWMNYGWWCRSADRGYKDPKTRYVANGFRVVVELPDGTGKATSATSAAATAPAKP